MVSLLVSLQSPWGVASGAIAGHLVATTVAILGGSFLANYISEKLVGLKKTYWINGYLICYPLALINLMCSKIL